MYFLNPYVCLQLNPLEKLVYGSQGGIGFLLFRLSCLKYFNKAVRYMLLLMSSFDVV